MQIEHDPLCAEYPSTHIDWTCECDLIAKVRTDERERIAQSIEYAWTSDYDSHAIRAYEDAARIARGE